MSNAEKTKLLEAIRAYQSSGNNLDLSTCSIDYIGDAPSGSHSVFDVLHTNPQPVSSSSSSSSAIHLLQLSCQPPPASAPGFHIGAQALQISAGGNVTTMDDDSDDEDPQPVQNALASAACVIRSWFSKP